MRETGGDQVEEAVAGCVAALRPTVARDWAEVRAGGLDWNCHETAVHVADDLLAYAANLAGRAQDAYVPFELKLDEFSFGILYAVFGVGAVTGAMSMPTLNRLLGADRANIWAMGITAVATLVAALEMTPTVVGLVVTLNGACWMTVIANNGASVQMILPNFMRARGMAVHQMVFFGSMVVGSMLWGKIANLWSVQTALIVSSLSLVPLTLLAATIRLPGSSVPRT